MQKKFKEFRYENDSHDGFNFNTILMNEKLLLYRKNIHDISTSCLLFIHKSFKPVKSKKCVEQQQQHRSRAWVVNEMRARQRC